MRGASLLLAGFVAAGCATPVDTTGADGPDGKDDRGTSKRFTEIDPGHTNPTFRTYIERALDQLAAQHSDIARLTLASIAAGHVQIDELADLTCADYLHVARDLPDLHLAPADHANLQKRGNATTAAITAELDGYMWSNRIYVARGMTPMHVAATLVHETNHVINHSEVGYYDDLPSSAFVHEYRAFYMEREFDPASYKNVDLVDYVITNYDLDRTKIHASLLTTPLTPTLLPDATAWKARRVDRDLPEQVTCE